MRSWLESLVRGPFFVGLVVAAAAAFLTGRLAPAGEVAPRPVVRTASPASAAGPPVTSTPVGRHAGASAHHLVVREPVAMHFHRLHDETVVVLSGSARLTLGGETSEIGPGTVLVIPRGTAHAVVPLDGPVEAVSVFSPPFDGEDRHDLE